MAAKGKKWVIHDKFIHHRILLFTGAKDYGFVYSLLNRIILLGILLKTWVPAITVTTAFIISICLAALELSFQWFIGRFLLNQHVIHRSIAWHNARNPLFRRLDKYLISRGFK